MENPQDVKQRDDRGRSPVQSPGSGSGSSEPKRDDPRTEESGKGGQPTKPGKPRSGEEEE